MTTTTKTSRRSFLKWSAAVGGAGALGAASVTALGMPSTRASAAVDGIEDADKTVWSACVTNCGSRCPLRLQVKDDVVVRVLPDNTGDDELGSQQVRACVRGRSIRHHIYNPDRLKTPLKRKPGTKRGEEQWEEISWEQALDEICDKIIELKDKYGNDALYLNYGTGVLGSTMACSWPPESSPPARLMNTIGGYLDHYGTYSTSLINAAYPYFYGGWTASNSLDDAANAQLQVMFGNNPLETRMSGGGMTYVTQQVKAKTGVRTIVIDPRLSPTAQSIADEWIAVRPATDAALVAGMIYVMVKEGLHDQAFLDKYCIGFDEEHMPEGAPPNSSYRSYLEGKGPDGIEKTPEWAAEVTGVPAATIERLAREIATAKPCAITQGWGTQRHANGENACRAVFLLACATGNPGIPGGGNGGREGAVSLPLANIFSKGIKNPREKIISVFSWFDAIQHGEEMDTFNSGVGTKPDTGARANVVPIGEDGEPTNVKLGVPIKFIANYGGNSLVNQTGDNNRSVEILQDDTKCELIITCDVQYTSSCRYSDYILPGTTTAEEEGDIHPGENATPMAYGIVSEQAVKPLYECKSIFDICTEMAKRFGTEQEFTEGMTREEWLRKIIDAAREEDPDLPDYDTWKKQGIFRKKKGSSISMKDFREDPVANPLKTPSGKIEIYSERLATMAEKWTFDDFEPARKGEVLKPLPEHVETWEGPEEARNNEKYPLQVIGHHFMGRTHSTYGNVDWLQEAHPQNVWINPIDAAERGIENDDEVFVYNERGTVKLPARVTPRIAPGVMSIAQGAWYDPTGSKTGIPADANPDKPVDVSGAVNSLTSLRPSALAKGNPVHTTLANVAKA